MHSKNKVYCRKVAWLPFGLIALAAISSARDSQPISETSYLSAQSTSVIVQSSTTPTSVVIPTKQPDSGSLQNELYQQELDHRAAEAARAYKQATTTLTYLKVYATLHSPYSSLGGRLSNSKSSFISSLLPNLQGQGPTGSLLRILFKLFQITFGRVWNMLSQDSFSREKVEELKGKAIKVVDLLQHSAELGNMDALYLLAQISLFPPTTHVPFNPRLAYNAFNEHASRTGNATSQSLLAFFHASGYKGIVPVDQGKAQLYATFAAHGGDKGAQMQLGYRYWSGIGTLENCQSALIWYGSAAEKAMEKFQSGPPGGLTLPQTPTRLSDLVGGVYGPGASAASTGVIHSPAIQAGLARAAGETWEDVLEYYLFNADRGEIDFAYRLGKIFYQGSIYATPGGIASGSEGVGNIPQNFKLARKYFLLITKKVWPHDPPNTLMLKDEGKPLGYAAASAAYLGRMYLRGEGVKVDYMMAKAWFERGTEQGDRECHNGLGIIYRDGLGVRVDVKKALQHFNAAATQELPEAQVNLGKYYFKLGDLNKAMPQFDSAIRNGSPFEAFYYLAEIHSASTSNQALPSHIKSSSCSMAVSFYKHVSERGVWDDDLVRDAEAAWLSDIQQEKEMAMVMWRIAAERGSEFAQNNVAYILDQDKTLLHLTKYSPFRPSNDTAHLALTQWIRAAAQRNIDALVKVGDYYYRGLGVPADEENVRYEKAARYYRSASDTQMSAMAMWNLGWMYENGVGVPQDFPLAKRYYDLALETNSEAYLPVTLSLVKLYARSFWSTMTGSKSGLNVWTSDAKIQTSRTKTKQLEEGNQAEGGTEDAPREEEERFSEGEDGSWYLGKAKEEFHRQRGQDDSSRGEEDPIQWARDRREAQRERESELGQEDYFDGSLRPRDREDIIDEFSETVLLVLLCAVISVLLYVRTRMVERMRREQREQQGQNGQAPVNENGGILPPVDQRRGDWAVLR